MTEARRPAFPGFSYVQGHGPNLPVPGPLGETVWATYEPGMSVFQLYAAVAMLGWLSAPGPDGDEARRHSGKLAEWSCDAAATLLAEVQKREAPDGGI